MSQIAPKILSAMGDSLTGGQYSYGVNFHDHWPAQLERMLAKGDIYVRARNYGIGGNTTAQMYARFREMFRYETETPALGIIFGGVNDPGASITQAQTQANLQAMARALHHGTGIIVADETALPAGFPAGTLAVVVSDGSSTGGMAPELPGAATGVRVWRATNGLAGVSGWGRIANYAAKDYVVPRVVLVSPQYRNYADTDTVASAKPSGTYANVYDAVVAAAAAEGVGFCNLFASMKARISGGFDSQNSASWHTTSDNQHLNAYGCWLAAGAVYETICAQTGWLDALT